MQETERFVRDLAWAVNSPNLMDLTSQVAVPSRPLMVSDIDAEDLRIHLTSNPATRVGRYFEKLIVYWIRSIRQCEIVAHSLQVREGKQTVGEIDLLFRDELGRLNHWELACKFYLQVNVGDVPTTDYIGPNANDTLRKKATRLTEHQLPLGSQYFPDIEVRSAFVKGRVFYHWQSGPHKSLPAELASEHLTGKWMRASEVPQLLRSGPMCYRILRKPFWLAEEYVSPTDNDILTTGEITHVLHNHFCSRATPILMSGFPDRTSFVRESERWFIVPDEWPRKTKRECRQ